MVLRGAPVHTRVVYRSIRIQVTIHGILLASDFDEVCKIDSMVISDESDGHVSPPSTVRGTSNRSAIPKKILALYRNAASTYTASDLLE